jgi:tRNA-specific adenosine deaminase 3
VSHALPTKIRSRLTNCSYIRDLRTSLGWSANYQCHLKRIKRLDAERLAVLLLPPEDIPVDDTSAFLDSIATYPSLLSRPYQTAVPLRAASTREQLAAFNAVWPVNFIPIRMGVTAQIMPKGLSRSHLDWLDTMIHRVERLGHEAEKRGELPIASLVSSSTLGPPLAEASDTRRSTGNLLCHSIANLIDQVAAIDLKNARHVAGEPPPYLLSGLTLFTTHEPCMMCSMALLHSRIAFVYYVRPSPEAGGLGSVLSVHEDRGLNHKFEAWRWTGERRAIPELQVDP